jgi:hypothetical protein
MKSLSWLHTVWKLAVCGLLFFFGSIPGSMLAAWIGLPAQEIPLGADQAILVRYSLLASLILAAGLSAVSRGLSVRFIARWLILSLFTWIAYGVNNYFEAAIFTTMAAASLNAVVLYLPASFLCSAAVAWLFPPAMEGPGFFAQARAFFATQTLNSWSWRLLAACLAFPLVYFFFGRLIAPIVLPYYLQGTNQLTLPGWDQILPVLALRSLLFLLICLPILITWKRSTLGLFLTLGLTLFLLVGGLNMLYAYWLAPVLRVAHTLEIFADEMVYTGALIILLSRNVKQPETKQVPVPVHQ